MDLKEIRFLACRDRRDLPIDLVDLKFTSSKVEDPVRFKGYASVWGRVDSYGDTIVKGAFAEALKERRPMMLFGHNPGRVPGKWVDFGEDDKGLYMEGELTPGHSEAADHAASLKHGALNGLSIGGYTIDGEMQKTGGRLIKKFDLYEVSLVSMPAEQEARIDTASVKATVDSFEKVSDFEDFLREAAGLSKVAAKLTVSRFLRIARRDGAPSEEDSKGAGEMLASIRDLDIPLSLLGAQK